MRTTFSGELNELTELTEFAEDDFLIWVSSAAEWAPQLSELRSWMSYAVVTSELRSSFESSDRLASRRSSARLESSLKRLIDWVSWHQWIWASNAENLDFWARIFRHSIFRNFHFEKFSIHKTHQI
jgi:hypothetical protein